MQNANAVKFRQENRISRLEWIKPGIILYYGQQHPPRFLACTVDLPGLNGPRLHSATRADVCHDLINSIPQIKDYDRAVEGFLYTVRA